MNNIDEARKKLEEVLLHREHRSLFGAKANDSDPVLSLISCAFDAWDNESADCISTLQNALNQANDSEYAKVACSIALVIMATDPGLRSDMPIWTERYRTHRGANNCGPISSVWAQLADVAMYNHLGSAISVEEIKESADAILDRLMAPSASVGPDTRVAAGQLLLEYAYACSDTAIVDLVISLIEHSATIPQAHPVFQVRYYEALGFHHYGRSKWDDAKLAWQKAEAIAIYHGLKVCGFMARVGLVRQLLDEGDLANAKRQLSSLRPFDGPGRLGQVVIFKHLKARDYLLRLDPSAARIEIEEAIELAHRIGWRGANLHLYLQEKAQILFAQNLYEQAEEVLLVTEGIDVGIAGLAIRANSLLMKCLRLLPENPVSALESLAAGLRIAREIRFIRFLRSLPVRASEICMLAFQHGIEMEFVMQAIRERSLKAPADAGVQWPWPLRIRTFGALAIELNGDPLMFPGRTQAKPVELLCFLASSNDLRSDSVSIASALWSADDLAKSMKSLETTTSRLRKLLGSDSLIEVGNGQTWLDSTQVWSDWAHAKGLSQRLIKASTIGADRAHVAVRQVSQELLTSYRGVFLAGSEEVPWLIGRREDATQRFVSAALAAKSAWPDKRDIDGLSAFLEAALVQEPLSETIAISLMKTYASQQRSADAMRVYRYLRDQMSIRLGIKPTVAVENVRRNLSL